MPDTALLKILSRIGDGLVAEPDVKNLVQMIVDVAVEISQAEIGSFFYHDTDENGEKLVLHTLSGAPESEFRRFGDPRPTPFLSSHIVEERINRVADVLLDPRYGQNAPHSGIPVGHLPVRSYMAARVQSRAGTHLGSILLGHGQPDKFTALHEDMLGGLVALAAVALDNARLYDNAQQEIVERGDAETALRSALDSQKLLLDELNHRVKNTLATVQSIAIQTKQSVAALSGDPSIEAFYDAFEARLLSLSRAHNLLVEGMWSGVSLCETALSVLHVLATPDRCSVNGPDIVLNPNAAVTLNMVFHELFTNALKYGSLSITEGHVDLSWRIVDDECVKIAWREKDGPVVSQPQSRGFGSKLIERGAMRELGGSSKLNFDPLGVFCDMTIPLSSKVRLK